MLTFNRMGAKTEEMQEAKEQNFWLVNVKK
jgi:hypothetical protein